VISRGWDQTDQSSVFFVAGISLGVQSEAKKITSGDLPILQTAADRNHTLLKSELIPE
jgi:hypothetical protein